MKYFAPNWTSLALLAMCGTLAPAGQTQNRAASPAADSAKRVEAKATFENVCAACHGLDGKGGERGPDVATRPDVVRKTDGELVKVLQDGKTAAGMPAFAAYGSERLSALVAYLRELQGLGKAAALPGDPAQGKGLFFGKARCAECHTLAGRGGFWAQDLTSLAGRMNADEVKAAILQPNANLDPRRGLVTVTLADSKTLTGVARNEDNFSLQLQTADGTFHLLNKTEIRSVAYLGRTAMPSDYEKTLSPKELNDLVSFLLQTSRKAARVGETWNDDDDE